MIYTPKFNLDFSLSKEIFINSNKTLIKSNINKFSHIEQHYYIIINIYCGGMFRNKNHRLLINILFIRNLELGLEFEFRSSNVKKKKSYTHSINFKKNFFISD